MYWCLAAKFPSGENVAELLWTFLGRCYLLVILKLVKNNKKRHCARKFIIKLYGCALRQ